MANPFKCGFVDKMESPLRLELRDPIAMHLRAMQSEPELAEPAHVHRPRDLPGLLRIDTRTQVRRDRFTR
jgi:hypothetical protein